MATSTAAAFQEFSNRLLLTEKQANLIGRRWGRVEADLDKHFPTSGNLTIYETKLIGSAGRGTIIRPPDDIDLLAVFFAEDWGHWKNDSQRFLYRVKETLDRGGATVVGARGQAVRIFYESGAKVDAAPAFPHAKGGWVIPRGDGGWMRTDPDKHAQFTRKANARLDNRLKPFVRKLKAWNRAHSLRLKSFHLEVMVAEVFQQMPSNSRENSVTFFDVADIYLDVHDPANHSGDLSKDFTARQLSEIKASFEAASKRAEKAVAAERLGLHRDAIKLWRWIYGDHFPAFG